VIGSAEVESDGFVDEIGFARLPVTDGVGEPVDPSPQVRNVDGLVCRGGIELGLQ
jgi:hypothetical protein